MANVTVYFATNRVAQGPTTDWHSYRADIIPPTDPSQIIYAEAFVEGTDLAVEGSGTITAISHPQTGGFETGVAQDIVGSGKNILIFIHGFANSFLNSIARAAYNREWFAASGANAADTTVIAFSWPSLGQLFAAPPHLLPDDYLRDQAQAGRSAFHIASFFANLQPMLTQVRNQGRRVFLLAHSMGNFALAGAVESWFSHGNPTVTLFDEVFLPAADERWDSFTLPMGARLTPAARSHPENFDLLQSSRRRSLSQRRGQFYSAARARRSDPQGRCRALPAGAVSDPQLRGSQRLRFVEPARCEPPILPPLAQGAR